MSDNISRADAIDALCHNCAYYTDAQCKTDSGYWCESGAMIREDIPSAELPKGDLISRADAICEVLVNDGIENIVDRINKLPSADAYFTDGNKIADWIPCSERLPKEKQEVYVTVYFIEGDTGRAYGYMDGFGKWHLFSAVEGTLNSGYEVIAWMPLPKPYREDGEEE